jgi:arylsulfatase A-like enzyme
LLISVEAMRADRLELHGGPVETPNLARLASLGTVFDDAATACPMSRPSATTLLTGLTPDRSLVRNDTYDRVSPMVTTLARRFGEEGRTTVAIVGSSFCSYGSGLQRDFELFDGPEGFSPGPDRYFPPVIADSEVAARFGQWLGSLDAGEEFFGWLHLGGLHGAATQANTVEESARAYDEALVAADEAVGAVLDALESSGRLSGTAVVLVGTHGVLLGEEEARGGSYWLRPETLRVPLIVKGGSNGSSAFEPGSRSSARAWLPDVPATLAALAGISLGDPGDGIDLARGPQALDRRVRRAWTWSPDDEIAWPTRTAVDDGSGWKGFRWGEIAAAGDEAAGALGLARARPAEPRPREVPAELRSRIEAEGLVKSWEEVDRPEPPELERSQFLARLQLVRHRLAERRAGETPTAERAGGARKRAQSLIDDYPENMAALSHRQFLMLAAGTIRLARRVTERALAIYPERGEILHWAAHIAHTAGETDRSEMLTEATLAVMGPDPDVLYDLACTRALLGDTDASLTRLEEAIEAGFRNWEHIERDPDLQSIRTDPRYVRLMGSYGR